MERGKRKDILAEDDTRLVARIGTDERQNGAGINGGRFCMKCDAWFGCYGLEPTPDLYVEHTVLIFREVRRVVRHDGLLWLNLGDTYCTKPSGKSLAGSTLQSGNQQLVQTRSARPSRGHLTADSVKDKDLIGIPWRVALALQADGWYLRAAIPWIKGSAMPESVSDRPTTAHEYVFLLSKSDSYYYDMDSVRRPSRQTTVERDRYSRVTAGKDGPYAVSHDHETTSHPDGRNRRTSDWFLESLDELRAVQRDFLSHLDSVRDQGGMLLDETGNPLAFLINPQPFKGAHFAVFPPRLIEPMILASTSRRGCCLVCRSPWRRITERYRTQDGERRDDIGAWRNTDPGSPIGAQGVGHWRFATVSRTLGWEPSCSCLPSDPQPCLVLDPFVGSGTTPQVATALGCYAVGLDLNRDYIAMARTRLERPHAPLRVEHPRAITSPQGTLFD